MGHRCGSDSRSEVKLGMTGSSEPYLEWASQCVDGEKDWEIDASNMERMFWVVLYESLTNAIIV